MTPPPNEQQLLMMVGVQGKRILEFGSKANSHGVYRDWYMRNGAASYESVDWNGEHGAFVADVRLPLADQLGVQRHDIVTNFGFSEHVDTNQEQFFRNAHDACLLGGTMIHLVPLVGHWTGHDGMKWAYTEHFLAALAVDCAYTIRTSGLDTSITQRDQRPKHLMYGVFIKRTDHFAFDLAAKEILPC